MKAQTYLISYQPYMNRDERCTLGALVFDDEGHARVHLANNLRKVKALDPSASVDDIRDGLRDFCHSFNDFDDSWKALKSGFGPFRFSESPGVFLYNDTYEYDRQVKSLLALIADPAPLKVNRSRQPTSRLFVDMRRTFKNLGWLAKTPEDLKEHLVVPHYPVSLQDHLYAEFAVQNGKLHIVETVDFRAGAPSNKRMEAQGKALLMDFAKDQRLDTNCTVIIAASDYSTVKPSTGLLGKYADRVISLDSHSDMNEFFNEWSKITQRPLMALPDMA